MEGRKPHCPPREHNNEPSIQGFTALPSLRAEHNSRPRNKGRKNSALPSSRAISGSSWKNSRKLFSKCHPWVSNQAQEGRK
ncbi:uncharacterized protein DS421_1g18530 [Arachis hypogaea]|nr:uncharacterized protein DS421_1g18530 [Arachis hypogaea]